MKVNLEKIYEKRFFICDIEFKLKPRLTFEESDQAEAIHNTFFNPSKLELIARLNSNDIEKFLSLILERTDRKPVDENFKFIRIKEDDLVRVCVFFSISKLKKVKDTEKDLESLMEELIEQ